MPLDDLDGEVLLFLIARADPHHDTAMTVLALVVILVALPNQPGEQRPNDGGDNAANALAGVGSAVIAMADPTKKNPPAMAPSSSPIASSDTKLALGASGSSSSADARQ